MEHIGIDVHKNQSQVCILTTDSELVEKRIRTDRDRFAAVLGSRPRAKILIEASTESEWVASCLEAQGHEVIVVWVPPLASAREKLRVRNYRGDHKLRSGINHGPT